MATEVQQSIIADIILDVFNNDPELFRSAMERQKLEAEYRLLESRKRNEQAAQTADSIEHQEVLCKLA
jgi:hypothetical protein